MTSETEGQVEYIYLSTFYTRLKRSSVLFLVTPFKLFAMATTSDGLGLAGSAKDPIHEAEDTPPGVRYSIAVAMTSARFVLHNGGVFGVTCCSSLVLGPRSASTATTSSDVSVSSGAP